MKTWSAGLLLSLSAAAGCTSMGQSHADFEKVQKRREVVLAKPAPPPVTPEQVTPENAYRVLQALRDEMDRETNRELLTPSSGSSEKN